MTLHSVLHKEEWIERSNLRDVDVLPFGFAHSEEQASLNSIPKTPASSNETAVFMILVVNERKSKGEPSFPEGRAGTSRNQRPLPIP